MQKCNRSDFFSPSGYENVNDDLVDCKLYIPFDFHFTTKKVFEIMVETGEEPQKIINKKGLKQQSDPKELEKMINEILSKNKDKVDQYKAGKEKLFGFFVGQVMKLSGGKANPQLTNEILKKLLKG
mgnify:CR=1 FL=1